MYINTKVFLKSGLNMNQVFTLQLIRQKDYNEEDPLLGKINLRFYEKLVEGEWAQPIKAAKKNEPIWKALRLTKKAKALMRDIEITEISEQSKKLGAQLISLYQNNGLEINKNNNKRDVHELIAWYLCNTDFNSRDIYGAVEDYINSTDKKFTSTLSNLIWKAENVYSVHRNLSKSKLYGLMT